MVRRRPDGPAILIAGKSCWLHARARRYRLLRNALLCMGGNEVGGGLYSGSCRGKFGERAEMVESLVNQCGRHDGLLLCRCGDLEQSLPTEVYWK
jgi:hypothetical protein